MKVYLGDSVYADVESGMVKLTTENGVYISNTIYLESEVVAAFEQWLQRLRESKEPPHQTGCICADCSGAELTTEND